MSLDTITQLHRRDVETAVLAVIQAQAEAVDEVLPIRDLVLHVLRAVDYPRKALAAKAFVTEQQKNPMYAAGS